MKELAYTLALIYGLNTATSCQSKEYPISLPGKTAVNEVIKDSIVIDSIVTPIEIVDQQTLQLTKDEEIYLSHKKRGQEQTFLIKNTNYSKIIVSIEPAIDSANLRINQLISPSGISNGPFGRELTSDLVEKGVYQLRIGESLMQGEPYQGKYTLKLRLK